MPQRPEPRATTESAQGLAAMLCASHLPMTSAPATCELLAGLAAQGRGWKAIGSSGRASLRASTTASGYLTSGCGHQRGLLLAINGDFHMATDSVQWWQCFVVHCGACASP